MNNNSNTNSSNEKTRISVLLTTLLILGVLIFLGNYSLVYADGQNGSIWTTDDTDTYQDKNHYDQGESVYIRGENLDPNTEYIYEISGQPGGASSDPNQTVATGQVITDENGTFIVYAYTVQPDDDGEYKVAVGNKQDNYRVEGVQQTTPPEDSPQDPPQDPPQDEPENDPPIVSQPPSSPPNSTPFLIPVTGEDLTGVANGLLPSLISFFSGVGLVMKSWFMR